MDQIPSLVIVVVALGALGLFMWWQTKNRGGWGLGQLQANCPRCAAPLPVIRKPVSMREMLWGGWTCPKCGCAVDKYGRERTK